RRHVVRDTSPEGRSPRPQGETRHPAPSGPTLPLRGRAIAFDSEQAAGCSLPPCGGGMGRGVSVRICGAKTTLPVRAHAKSDVSDLANMPAEIGNGRFRMARTDLPHKGGGNRSEPRAICDSPALRGG